MTFKLLTASLLLIVLAAALVMLIPASRGTLAEAPTGPASPPAHQEHDTDHHHDQPTGVHADHDHSADHDQVHRVELTDAQRRRIDLEIATAGPGTITRQASFPGQVLLDPDHTAAVVPPAAGIVRQVAKTLGDRVEAGEVLAWIESAELAEAKLTFYAKRAEVACCRIEVPRARQIYENTARLLALLDKEAPPEQLHSLDGMEMGQYRSQLIGLYNEYLASRQTYEREKRLRDKGISSGQELLEAETAFRKARDAFLAAKDTARYETLLAYTQAVRERQVAEFEAVEAEKRLRLKGAEDTVVKGLLALVPQTAGLQPCLCDDPQCKENQLPSVMDALGRDKRFGWYALRAPQAGYIVERRLTLGEKIDTEHAVFQIADTSRLWVNSSVPTKDLAGMRRGQSAHVHAGRAGSFTGKVDCLLPVVEQQTRSVTARIVLDNPQGTLRPGQYVTVQVTAQTTRAPVVVPLSAVQVLEERPVVFVEHDQYFQAVPVELGLADDRHVAVTAGLEPGRRYVAGGAFELKARIVASGLGAHAGHGH